MNIKLERFKQTKECTSGKLYRGVFQCCILEDVFRETKVYSKTRIPKCKYTIKLRTVGNFHQKYLVKFREDFNKVPYG